MAHRSVEQPSAANAVVAALVMIFLLAPLLIVVPMSFSAASSFEFPPRAWSLRHYATFFTSAGWLHPTLNSFVIGILSSLLSLLVATPAAFALNRRRLAGRRALQILLLMPMLVPAIVMAISYYTLFGQIGLNQTYTGIILAHCCISIPVVLLTSAASLRGLDRNLERAAAICGANPAQILWRVIIPLLRPTFLVAGLFAFIHSFDEATISLFISGRDVTTLPRRMFASMQLEADPVVSVVSSLLITAAAIGTAVATTLRARRGRLR